MKSVFDLIIYALPYLLKGALVTVEIAVFGMVLGIILGTGLVILRMTKIHILEMFVTLYVSFIRGTPFLIQILIVFYSLSTIGLDLSNSLTGIVAVGINCAAFISEVIRTGLNAIPKGHIEAAEALGMSRATIFVRIKMAQVFKIVKPQMLSEFINAVKCTPILSTIGVVEITRAATRIVTRKFHPIIIYMIAFILYFIICSVLEFLEKKIRKKEMPA